MKMTKRGKVYTLIIVLYVSNFLSLKNSLILFSRPVMPSVHRTIGASISPVTPIPHRSTRRPSTIRYQFPASLQPARANRYSPASINQQNAATFSQASMSTREGSIRRYQPAPTRRPRHYRTPDAIPRRQSSFQGSGQ